MLKRVEPVVSVLHTAVWHLLRKKLKTFPYHFRAEKQLSSSDKQTFCFCSTLRWKVGGESQIFVTHCVLVMVYFFAAGCREQATLQQLGIQTTMSWLLVPAKLSNIISLVRYLQNRVQSLSIYGDIVTRARYKSTLQYYLFPKLVQCPLDVTFRQKDATSHHTIPLRQYPDHKLSDISVGGVDLSRSLHGLMTCPVRLFPIVTWNIEWSASYRTIVLISGQNA